MCIQYVNIILDVLAKLYPTVLVDYFNTACPKITARTAIP